MTVLLTLAFLVVEVYHLRSRSDFGVRRAVYACRTHDERPDEREHEETHPLEGGYRRGWSLSLKGELGEFTALLYLDLMGLVQVDASDFHKRCPYSWREVRCVERLEWEQKADFANTAPSADQI